LANGHAPGRSDSADLESIPELLTATDLGGFLRVDTKTVLRHKELRRFSLNLGHRIVRWSRIDVARWLEEKGTGAAQESLEAYLRAEYHLSAHAVPPLPRKALESRSSLGGTSRPNA
jgi:hypothetical protein